MGLWREFEPQYSIWASSSVSTISPQNYDFWSWNRLKVFQLSPNLASYSRNTWDNTRSIPLKVWRKKLQRYHSKCELADEISCDEVDDWEQNTNAKVMSFSPLFVFHQSIKLTWILSMRFSVVLCFLFETLTPAKQKTESQNKKQCKLSNVIETLIQHVFTKRTNFYAAVRWNEKKLCGTEVKFCRNVSFNSLWIKIDSHLLRFVSKTTIKMNIHLVNGNPPSDGGENRKHRWNLFDSSHLKSNRDCTTTVWTLCFSRIGSSHLPRIVRHVCTIYYCTVSFSLIWMD